MSILGQRFAYRLDSDSVHETDTNTSEEKTQPEKKREEHNTFHIPKLSAIQHISSQEYIEHTGNESMPAEYRYFGVGVFVRPKGRN
jgi:hypothetical protein